MNNLSHSTLELLNYLPNCREGNSLSAHHSSTMNLAVPFVEFRTERLRRAGPVALSNLLALLQLLHFTPINW